MKFLNKVLYALLALYVAPCLFAAEVTVLVVYTDDARVGAGSVANIETQIIAAIDDGNEMLANSNVDIDLINVGMRELAVNENVYGTSIFALNDALVNPFDAQFGPVHNWRNETDADIVFLVYEGIDANGLANEVCGTNFACNVAFERHAFAVGQRGLMVTVPFLFIHEMGHVMGLWHDRTRDCGNEGVTCVNGAFPYSYGHIDPIGPNWGTIMAGGARTFDLIDFFSNPDLTNPATGQVIGIEDRSDAARSLNDVRHIVSQFRPLLELEGPDYACYPQNTVYTLTNPANLPVSWQTTSNLSIISSNNTSVTVRANSSRSPGTITAVLAGRPNEVKDVWVGRPASPSYISGPSTARYGAIIRYRGSAVRGSTGYKWYLPYPYNSNAQVTVDPRRWGILSGGNSRYLRAIVGSNNGYVQFMGTNPCGTGGAKYIRVRVSTNSGGGNIP